MSAEKWAIMKDGANSLVSSSCDSMPKTRISSFDTSVLPFGHKTHTAVELLPSDQLFSLVLSHLSKYGTVVEEDATSFRMSQAEKTSGGGNKHGACCGSVAGHDSSVGRDLSNISVSLGLGVFRFSHSGQELCALHQNVGDPVGTGCGAQVLSSVVLFREGVGPSAARVIQEFLSELLAESERTAKNTFQVYRWHIKYQFWQRVTRVVARPVSSVVLPAEASQTLVSDLEEFLSDGTAQFYQDHGIPYKRSYLFYGVPGAGKTSMIQALAGRFGRNLCYLSPTHPELSDDSLKSAIERVPDNAIVVLEDVDALFGKGREKKIHQSPLTFSGLLNALDGVGNHNGLVFVLTTNFKDQLDAALIRDGRVDLRVRFDYCTPEQMEKLFDNFYPPKVVGTSESGCAADAATMADSDPEIAALEAKLAAMKRAKAAAADGKAAEADGAKEPNGAAFRDALLLSLGDRQVTAAQLQSFFVSHRKNTAAETIAAVGAVAAAIDKREEEEAAKKEDSPAAKAGATPDGECEKKLPGSNPGGSGAARGQGGAPSEGKVVHVHVHTSDA
jgi:chaperone BCS1